MKKVGIAFLITMTGTLPLLIIGSIMLTTELHTEPGAILPLGGIFDIIGLLFALASPVLGYILAFRLRKSSFKPATLFITYMTLALVCILVVMSAFYFLGEFEQIVAVLVELGLFITAVVNGYKLAVEAPKAKTASNLPFPASLSKPHSTVAPIITPLALKGKPQTLAPSIPSASLPQPNNENQERHVNMENDMSADEKMDAERDIMGLIKILDSSDTSLRASAVVALGKIGAPAVEPLIATLMKCDLGRKGEFYSHHNWLQAIPDALAKIGTPAVDPLIALLERGSYIATYASETLVKIGTPAVESAIAVLEDKDKKWFLRYYVAEVLGGIGDARAIDPLLDAKHQMETEGLARDNMGRENMRYHMIIKALDALKSVSKEKKKLIENELKKEEISYSYGCPKCAWDGKFKSVVGIPSFNYSCGRCGTMWSVDMNGHTSIWATKDSRMGYVSYILNECPKCGTKQSYFQKDRDYKCVQCNYEKHLYPDD